MYTCPMLIYHHSNSQQTRAVGGPLLLWSHTYYHITYINQCSICAIVDICSDGVPCQGSKLDRDDNDKLTFSKQCLTCLAAEMLNQHGHMTGSAIVPCVDGYFRFLAIPYSFFQTLGEVVTKCSQDQHCYRNMLCSYSILLVYICVSSVVNIHISLLT